MNKILALVIFLAVCAGLYLLATKGQGIDVNAINPNPASLESRRSALEATSQAAALQADRIRDAQVATVSARADQFARETQAVVEAIRRQTEAAMQQTAAVEYQQTRAAFEVTVQAGQAQGTATAQVQATWDQATARAVDIQATAEAAGVIAFQTQQAQTVLAGELALRNQQVRAEVNSALRYWPVYLALVLLVLFAIAEVWLLKQRADTNIKTVSRAPNGELEGVAMGGKLHNLDRAVTSTIDPRRPALAVTAEQLEVTRRHQAVQGIAAMVRAGLPRAARQTAEQIAAPSVPGRADGEPPDDLPVEAPWEALDSWSGGNLLPLGVGVGRTGITLDPDRVPHLLYAGTSGSGKTISGLRPLATLALSAGWQVILLNPAAGDFAPLRAHPNLVSIPNETLAIIETAEWVAREVDRRSLALERLDTSTYARLGDAQSRLGPRIMVVMDELVALAQTVDGLLRARLWRAIVHLTSKGRKMGLSFVGATTDPTYRSLGRYGLTVRDNCGRVVFKVLDASVSHAILGDSAAAVDLNGCQFLARLDSGLVRGAAFHPGDEQIRAFLSRHPVLELPAPAFLEDGLTEKTVDPEQDRAQRIRDLAAAGKSLNEIQREVFGFSGGQAYTAVKNVLNSTGMGAASTTTSESASTTVVLDAA